MKSFVLFIFTLIAGILVEANSTSHSALDELFDRAALSEFQQSLLYKVLPQNYEKGINDYLNMIGFTPNGMQNSSIADYNATLLIENTCIRRLAIDIYSMIEFDVKGNVGYGVSKIFDIGFTRETPPGSVWNYILEKSGGDRNLAMQILGICGHDDRHQIANRFHTSNLSDGNRLRLTCPLVHELFYYPKSLGKKYDIDERLKNEIVKFQYGGERDNVPSKAYHIMGAAYTTCAMFKRGMPRIVVENISKRAVNAYRAGRLCEVIKGLNLNIEDYDFKRIRDKYQETLENPESCGLTVNRETNSTGSHRPVDDKVCQFLQTIPGVSQYVLERRQGEFVDRKIRYYMARMDAANMMRSFSYYRDRANQCQGIQKNFSIYEFLSYQGNLRNVGAGDPCRKILKLNAERCERSRRIIKTWALDFDWSFAQHELGIEFASENCKQVEDGYEEKKACKILDSREKPEGEDLELEQGAKH